MSILIAQYKYYSYDNFNHTISGWSVFTMGWIGVAILGLTIGIVAKDSWPPSAPNKPAIKLIVV